MIPMFGVYMSEDVDEHLLKTLHSGWIGQGPKVEEFEKKLSDYFQNPYVLSLSAGTHGLHLALKLAGVGPEDSVITTPLTCTATNWPILMQGANIVWADIDPKTLNIDPESIKSRVTGTTKAVIVVHWGGYPCDLENIKKVLEDTNVCIIEDAAHAFGSTYKGHPIGGCHYSDYTMMSFQSIKHLTCGDGGGLFLRDKKDYEKAKLLRWYGIDREGPRKDMRCEANISEWGYKYHMNDLSATIGIHNFKGALQCVDLARRNAEFYNSKLATVPGVTLVQPFDKEHASSYWMYTILVQDRTGFARLMGEKGIMVSRVHERNDIHSCVAQFKASLPNLDSIINNIICIPCGWWLSLQDREHIVDSIKEGW